MDAALGLDGNWGATQPADEDKRASHAEVKESAAWIRADWSGADWGKGWSEETRHSIGP